MKDYKKILEGVVNIINTAEKIDIGFANICTYIGENCPELKESEDDRMIQYFKDLAPFDNADELYEKYGFSHKDAIAWLEKQCEQKIKTPEESLGIDSCTYNKIVDECIYGEQNPAWSEKDNEHVNSLLKRLDGFCRKEFTTTRFAINEDENWLKSLKDKYTWKPSKEQMNTLEYYMHTLVCNEHKEVLFGLYADLKKLMEK